MTPQPGHVGHLVQVQQLGVNHDGAEGTKAGMDPLCRIQRGQILGGGRVAVAVGQRLEPVSPGKFQRLPQGLVGHGAVTDVAGVLLPLIGRAHPGGAALGGTVQKQLDAAQLEGAVITLDGGGKRRGQRIPLIPAGVAHHIQLQAALVHQSTVERRQLLHHHAVLYRGDSVGGVILLSLLVGVQQVVLARHGDVLKIKGEGGLLQIAGGRPVLSFDSPAFGVGGVRAYPQLLKGGGVEHPHVAGICAG